MKKLLFICSMIFIMTSVAMANKTSVEVNVPEEAEKGSEITIVIHVSHSGNSRLHHTNWVYLKINGEEVKRWEYEGNNLPEDADFTLEFKYTLSEDMPDGEGLIIEAEGNCNLHGTAGISKATVKVL
jgi:desulfoferrodoxin (superoxide reductase-like protein)